MFGLEDSVIDQSVKVLVVSAEEGVYKAFRLLQLNDMTAEKCHYKIQNCLPDKGQLRESQTCAARPHLDQS